MPHATDSPWTPHLDARLRAEWAAGTSASEIGRQLGVSKNAVIGRAHRLYLPSRPSPIRRKGEPSPPRPTVARECQYITSKSKPWRFCGAPCVTGQSWCAEHARRVHLPTLRQSIPAPE
jgi:GcrA cell cycle regulator